MPHLAGSESYAYDALGRRTSGTRRIDGIDYATTTTCNNLGLPQTVRYPDEEVVTYEYNAAGQVRSAAGAMTYVSSMTYTASGQVEQITYGKG